MGCWSFRGKSANLAVLVLAVALVGAVPTGAVYVTTLPAGADVWLDGTYLGRSPIVVDAVSAGAHHLTLTRTGWSAQDLGVTVVPATTVTQSVVLVHATNAGGQDTGTIAIHGERVGSILVDGETMTLGKDGSLAVSAGTHELTLQVARGKITRSVTVYPLTRTDVVLRTETETRSVVIAPADDYVPAGAVKLDATKLVIRYAGHDVIAKLGSSTYAVDGRPAVYDAAPTVIAGRLYLPIELLTLLTANDKK